jgi:hypothetical protein
MARNGMTVFLIDTGPTCYAKLRATMLGRLWYLIVPTPRVLIPVEVRERLQPLYTEFG